MDDGCGMGVWDYGTWIMNLWIEDYGKGTWDVGRPLGSGSHTPLGRRPGVFFLLSVNSSILFFLLLRIPLVSADCSRACF